VRGCNRGLARVGVFLQSFFSTLEAVFGALGSAGIGCHGIIIIVSGVGGFALDATR